MVDVLRAFVETSDGQIHYRKSRPLEGTGTRPLVMIHASPGSSKMLSSLIGQLGNNRQVYATDTLGNGDSATPKVVSPDIAYFAEAHMRAFDALELKTFDLYGTHTGGCIAAEIAIRHPQRVNRMILDGMSLYSDVERADMLEHYALEIKPDLNGAYLAWAWHFCRDNYLFWPWYKRDQDHRRALGLPAADVLHDKLVEVLKAVKSYHLSYHAAIDYKKPDRLPLVLTSTLLTCARNDMLLQYFDEVATLLAHAERSQNAGVATPAALAETAGIFQRFLDKGGASNASGGSRAGH